MVGCERLSFPAGKIINEVGKGGYRYLRILDLNKVSDEEIKQQLKKEYSEICIKRTPPGNAVVSA